MKPRTVGPLQSLLGSGPFENAMKAMGPLPRKPKLGLPGMASEVPHNLSLLPPLGSPASHTALLDVPDSHHAASLLWALISLFPLT